MTKENNLRIIKTAQMRFPMLFRKINAYSFSICVTTHFPRTNIKATGERKMKKGH